jgi:hypothetical protein
MSKGLFAWGIYDEPKYQGMSGAKYKYDLSRSSDKMKYGMDIEAQINDRLSVDPRVDLDKKMGQFGGGIYPY